MKDFAATAAPLQDDFDFDFAEREADFDRAGQFDFCADWPAWTDDDRWIVVPNVEESPALPSRREFLGGLLGVAAGAALPPSVGRVAGASSPSPILRTYRKLVTAQADVNRAYAHPCPERPGVSHADVCRYEEWQAGFTKRMDRIYDELVALVAAAAGLDLADLPNGNREGSARWEFIQEPMACHREGSMLFVLLLSACQTWSVDMSRDESDPNAIRGVRLAVLDLEGGPR